jgi:hypothetical protein
LCKTFCWYECNGNNNKNNNNNDFNVEIESSSDEDDDDDDDCNNNIGEWQEATTTAFLLNNLSLLVTVSRFLAPEQAISLIEKAIPDPDCAAPGFAMMRTMCKAGLPKFDLYKSDFYLPLREDGSRQTISLTAEEIKEYKSVYEPFFGRLSWDFVEQDFV